MTRRQKQSLALLMPVTLALVMVLGAGLAQPVPDFPVAASSSQVEARRIRSNALALSAMAPERVMGSTGHAAAREWIIQQLTALSLTVETLPFTVTIASEEHTGVNVWATAPGETSEIILITTSYDTLPASNAVYRDTSPSLATWLELARVLSHARHQYSLVFLASDASAHGLAWGAARQAQHDPPMIALEIKPQPDSGQTLVPLLKSDGLYQGFAPLWLRQISKRALQLGGRSALDADGVLEWGLRALPYGLSDTAWYLGSGIPAIRFNGEVESVARGVEVFIRTLDTLASLPPDSVNAPYWRISETHYLPNWATPFLQLLLFAPLLVFTAVAYRKDRPREEELRPEFTAYSAWVVVGLDGYAIAFSLVAARLLPQYEFFPAAPGDPFLLRPTWWAALAIYGTMALIAWYTFRGWRGSGGWGRFADMLAIPHRQTTLLILLSGLALVAWFVNGFTAVMVFGLPAYVWPWIKPRGTLSGKLFNTALAFTGLLPLFFGLMLVFGDPAFGPWWWFFPMGAAYGFFPLLTVLGFIGFSALFIRFLRHGWR